jgi:hypothetical protein
MMNRTLVALAALTVLALKSNSAEAHGGGLDAYGCHTNHKTGDYHCHGGGRSRGSYSPIYRVPQAPQSYTEYRPKVKSKPAVDFTCVGSSFQDPTDSNYTYCPVSGGYGINKGGSKTGVAAEGSAAFAAIKAVESGAPVTSAEFTCIGPTFKGELGSLYCRTAQGFGVNRNGLPAGEIMEGSVGFNAIQALETKHSAAASAPSERPSNYGYVFRAFIGTLSAFYFGVIILAKDMREIGGGWHFLWSTLAVWSMTCAIGVISISTFLCPFIAIVITLIAVGALLGSIPFFS